MPEGGRGVLGILSLPAPRATCDARIEEQLAVQGGGCRKGGLAF